MKPLSAQRKRVLAVIREFLDERGYPPTVRDIVRECEMSSTSVADYHLRTLEKEGFIRRDSGVSRGMEVVGEERRVANTVKVPLIGAIAAGAPLPFPTTDSLTTVDSLDTLELPQGLVNNKKDLYALRVNGTSMIDALIDDGDLVLMEYTNTADDGDLVAAWLVAEEEVTLKRFYRESDRVRLQPANTQMEPIYVTPSNLSIKGKVVGVIRQLL